MVKMDFSEMMILALQDRILKGISNLDVITLDYNDRFKLPSNFINEVYKQLDLESVKKKLIERLEDEMADKIANKLITEYSNDIKQIMSNRELREDLRFYARNIIKNITDKVSE